MKNNTVCSLLVAISLITSQAYAMLDDNHLYKIEVRYNKETTTRKTKVETLTLYYASGVCGSQDNRDVSSGKISAIKKTSPHLSSFKILLTNGQEVPLPSSTAAGLCQYLIQIHDKFLPDNSTVQPIEGAQKYFTLYKKLYDEQTTRKVRLLRTKADLGGFLNL
jgi:hypothetical protein